MKDMVRYFGLMIVGILLGMTQVSAQISTGTLGQEILRPSSASYYYIAKPSELSMQVNIWGFVRNPGRYEIPTTTNLVQLLSYAGGPLEDGIIDNVKITRGVGSPLSGGTPSEVIVDLEDLKNANPQDLILYPNDTVFIDHSDWGNVQDVFQVITVLAIVTGAVAQVIIATSRANN
jgi:NADH:ubiquinone oxidoreductase subunit F (NADH-binding)